MTRELLDYVELDYMRLIDMLDDETREHCVRTAIKVKDIVIPMQMSTVDTQKMIVAAYLHDIGKYYIQEKVLKKPGKLTDLERSIVDMHSYYGYMHLKDIGIDDEICQLVLLHHGIFKPRPGIELTNEKIIFLSAILRTADAYDALTSERTYHEAKTNEEALEILRNAKDVFDPAVVILLSDEKNDKKILTDCKETSSSEPSYMRLLK